MAQALLFKCNFHKLAGSESAVGWLQPGCARRARPAALADCQPSRAPLTSLPTNPPAGGGKCDAQTQAPICILAARARGRLCSQLVNKPRNPNPDNLLACRATWLPSTESGRQNGLSGRGALGGRNWGTKVGQIDDKCGWPREFALQKPVAVF